MSEPLVTLIPVCRLCGCDDLHACPGGCWWVGPDLCSACEPAPGDVLFVGTVGDFLDSLEAAS